MRKLAHRPHRRHLARHRRRRRLRRDPEPRRHGRAPHPQYGTLRLRRRRHGPQRRARATASTATPTAIGTGPPRSPPTAAITACSPCSTICRAAAPTTSSRRRRARPARGSAISTRASWTRPRSTPPASPRSGRCSTRSAASATAASGRPSSAGCCAARSARPFNGAVNSDERIPTQMIMHLSQSGLGLPDRDYYLSDDAGLVQKRAAYQAYLAQLLTLAGEQDAAARAAAVLRLRARHRPGPVDPRPESRRGADLQQMGDGRFRPQRAGLRLGRLFPRGRRRRPAAICSSPSRAPSPAPPG